MNEKGSVRLSYVPRTSTRRIFRFAARVWPISLALSIIGAVTAIYGPDLWRRHSFIKAQAACLNATLPADRPVWEGDPTIARTLLERWPSEYRRDGNGGAARQDPRWVAYLGALPAGQTGPTPAPLGVTSFLHERTTPSGQRRLVVVEDGDFATVISPATWTEPARVLRRAPVRIEPASERAFYGARQALASESRSDSRSAAGVCDSTDRSRFTVDFKEWGVSGTWEYSLQEDDSVTMRMLDARGFSQRVMQATAGEGADRRGR